jgi:hypothetical protein
MGVCYTFCSTLYCSNGLPEQWSQQSDSLRAGRSAFRMPVGLRFSGPIQTDLEAHPASCTMYTCPFTGGKATRALRWPPLLAQRREWAELCLCLCSCIASNGTDFILFLFQRHGVSACSLLYAMRTRNTLQHIMKRLSSHIPANVWNLLFESWVGTKNIW